MGKVNLAEQLVRNAQLAAAHARGEYTGAPLRTKRVRLPDKGEADGATPVARASRPYAIVIEGGDGSFSAYAPDVPGVGVAGGSVEEVSALLREALAAHFALLAASGESVPAPASRVATVDVPLPIPAAPATR